MRTQLGVICSAVMLALSAYASIIYSPFANSGDIPDGGVKLQISKGNGELYACLSDDSILVGDLSLGCVGLESNRTWTLFMGDLCARARSKERDSSLEITAVPKEGNLALNMVAGVGVFLVAVLVRSRPVRHWAHTRRAAVEHWIDAV